MRKDPIERLLRAAYSALLYLLIPVTVYHLIWRGFRARGYLQRWNERFGYYLAPTTPVDVWLHAVSVGEVNAAVPVVNALRKQHPELRWLVTTITPTGAERARALWGESVQHVYAPYDLSFAVGRFLRAFRPKIALVMETELWPNLLFGCRDYGVPAYILNARLSARSLRGYALLSALVSRMVRTLHGIGAQSRDDGDHFVALGAAREKVVDTGNLKFDIATPANVEDFTAQCRTVIGARKVWIAASTHGDEEEPVLEMHRRLREKFPDLLLLWAPRHAERFAKVADAARDAGFRVGTRRAETWPNADDEVFVIDTFGELMNFYACAEVAFVGGSLQAIGGHNLLEAAAVGTAIVTGPHLHNFKEISQRLHEAGALEIGKDAGEVCAHVADLLGDESKRDAMVTAGRALVEHGRGALPMTLGMIAADLPN